MGEEGKKSRFFFRKKTMIYAIIYSVCLLENRQSIL